MVDLGWSYADLGKRLGVHPNTYGRWKKRGLPEYAVAYLGLAIRLKRIRDIADE